MVGIQIGSEQEEKKREEERGFENIVDFNVPSNTEEKLAGATLSSAEDFKVDVTLQLDGERRYEGVYHRKKKEEKKREEERGFENIVDFNFASNAEEKFAGMTLSSAEDFKFDMTL